ncbi:uncharacterized protein, partial [Antedon mediterranea]|uniref:uncharacterized protein n=1 Tax=Antedon mediterranea TaxID=105859 RepID=UPI003AF51CF3
LEEGEDEVDDEGDDKDEVDDEGDDEDEVDCDDDEDEVDDKCDDEGEVDDENGEDEVNHLVVCCYLEKGLLSSFTLIIWRRRDNNNNYTDYDDTDYDFTFDNDDNSEKIEEDCVYTINIWTTMSNGTIILIYVI